MVRKYNEVEVNLDLPQVVDVALSDEQILKASAEIWNEDPTKFMGEIIAYASTIGIEDGLSLSV